MSGAPASRMPESDDVCCPRPSALPGVESGASRARSSGRASEAAGRARRDIVTGKAQYKEVSLDTLLADLKRRHDQQQATGRAGMRMKDDQLVQLFPGADYPEMQVDALIQIPDRWAPSRRPNITPLSMIICEAQAKVRGVKMPFMLAAVAGPTGPDVDDATPLIVQWRVPPMDKISNRGRGKDCVDLFGPWRSTSMLTLMEAADMELPSAVVDRSKVLMGPIDLDDSKLTYQDLDTLIDTYRIDVTGLTWTQTKNGNAFRLYRLMR